VLSDSIKSKRNSTAQNILVSQPTAPTGTKANVDKPTRKTVTSVKSNPIPSRWKIQVEKYQLKESHKVL